MDFRKDIQRKQGKIKKTESVWPELKTKLSRKDSEIYNRMIFRNESHLFFYEEEIFGEINFQKERCLQGGSKCIRIVL